MSKISTAFLNGKALMAYITCGDPDLGTTTEIVKNAVDNGANIIGLGIPFSDPTAEGPVIQESTIAEMSAAGSIIIIALGLNMLGASKVKIANLIPAMFLPLVFCLFL